jgi:hypothetical protein
VGKVRLPGRELKSLAGAAPHREIGFEAMMVTSRLMAGGRRAEMSQLVTPEEIAALFEGLREAEGEPGSLHRDLPEERSCPEAGFSLQAAELPVPKIYRTV